MKRGVRFEKADDVGRMIAELIKRLKLNHVKVEQISCLRSLGSQARAYARVWGLARVFQIGFGHPSGYVIEVLAEHFDKLDHEGKIKTLIHELLHIPKTFSGALLPHRGRHHRIGKRAVDRWYQVFKASGKVS